MKLLFLTTSNLATNPRLVKELLVATEAGYETHVVCMEFDNWSRSINDRIISEYEKVSTIYRISAGRTPFLPWMYSTVLDTLARFLFKLGLKSLLPGIFNKRTVLLLEALKSLKGRPFDLVIAHNPGALYPAWKYSQQHHVPFGFDAEDYHPGEFNDKKESERTRRMMRKYLRDAAYITGASPLILDFTLRDIDHTNAPVQVVNNCFSVHDFLPPRQVMSGNLKLVWFSQYIDQGRGLENLLSAIKKHGDGFELHLYGHLKTEFFEQYIKQVPNVFLHEPLPQKELHAALAGFDVGLALENGSSNLNRDICLTNKLLAYFQSGLFILATKTKGQEAFLASHPGHGLLAGEDEASLLAKLDQMKHQKEEIRRCAVERFNRAISLSWETESRKLLQLWQQVTQKRS